MGARLAKRWVARISSDGFFSLSLFVTSIRRRWWSWAVYLYEWKCIRHDVLFRLNKPNRKELSSSFFFCCCSRRARARIICKIRRIHHPRFLYIRSYWPEAEKRRVTAHWRRRRRRRRLCRKAFRKYNNNNNNKSNNKKEAKLFDLSWLLPLHATLYRFVSGNQGEREREVVARRFISATRRDINQLKRAQSQIKRGKEEEENCLFNITLSVCRIREQQTERGRLGLLNELRTIHTLSASNLSFFIFHLCYSFLSLLLLCYSLVAAQRGTISMGFLLFSIWFSCCGGADDLLLPVLRQEGSRSEGIKAHDLLYWELLIIIIWAVDHIASLSVELRCPSKSEHGQKRGSHGFSSPFLSRLFSKEKKRDGRKKLDHDFCCHSDLVRREKKVKRRGAFYSFSPSRDCCALFWHLCCCCQGVIFFIFSKSHYPWPYKGEGASEEIKSLMISIRPPTCDPIVFPFPSRERESVGNGWLRQPRDPMTAAFLAGVGVARGPGLHTVGGGWLCWWRFPITSVDREGHIMSSYLQHRFPLAYNNNRPSIAVDIVHHEALPSVRDFNETIRISTRVLKCSAQCLSWCTWRSTYFLLWWQQLADPFLLSSSSSSSSEGGDGHTTAPVCSCWRTPLSERKKFQRTGFFLSHSYLYINVKNAAAMSAHELSSGLFLFLFCGPEAGRVQQRVWSVCVTVHLSTAGWFFTCWWDHQASIRSCFF